MMTEIERLNAEITGLDEGIFLLCEKLISAINKRKNLRGQLNRARRLEREELQHAKH